MNLESAVILGLMSGTSLDGIDFALCRFYFNNGVYNYDIINTGFYPYDKKMKSKLSSAHELSAIEFLKFNKAYGSFLGKQINLFLKNKQKPDYIASHGHTVCHDPGENLTFQIGDGAFIAAETGISVISDFRNLDTALKGEGAPLVPIGDRLLFHDFDYCINLGGFANVSYEHNSNRIAYDICPVNIILNKYSNCLGSEFDEYGGLGKAGSVNEELLNELNNISYYKRKPPKSLGREYVESVFEKIFDDFSIPVQDKLRTYYEHIASQINVIFPKDENTKVLITGGGAHNTFLLELIYEKSCCQIIIPEKEIVDFKEAIIFAFLGFLRIRKETNTLRSVTGAVSDSIGGSVYLTSETDKEKV